MKRLSNGILSACLLLTLLSCRELYEPEILTLDFGFLVVEGNIEVGGNEPARIRLSRTRSIYDTLPTSTISQAQVWAESDSGERYYFSHTNNGVYLHEESIPFGQQYRLQIQLNNGVSYSSEWIAPMKTPEIENVYFEKEEEGVFIYLDSSEGNESGYLFWSYEEIWQFATPFTSQFRYEPEVNDMVVREDPINICFIENKPGRILLSETDRFGNGQIKRQEVLRIPNESEKLGIRYSIEIVQRSIDTEAFEFWDIMRKNTEDIGDVFSPMPSIIPTNIKNNDDPDEPVVGFVGVSSTERKRIYINSFDILPWRARIPEYNNCVLTDTIRPFQFAAYFSTGRFLPLYGIELDDDDGFGIAYLTTTVPCADCRLRGDLEKPEFWEER